MDNPLTMHPTLPSFTFDRKAIVIGVLLVGDGNVPTIKTYQGSMSYVQGNGILVLTECLQMFYAWNSLP